MLHRLWNWMYVHRADVGLGVLLLVVAAVPRVFDLGTFLTADEKNWMGRAYEFVRAVKDLRFNDTVQTTHPGVTTLWVSGAAIYARMFSSHTLFTYDHLAHFAAAAQLPIALLTSMAVPFIYFFLRKLLESRAVPLLASLLIALNPWLIGYSRVVHVDALLASLMILAGLATVIHARSGYQRRWLIAAAVLSGFAILTKFPAVFLLPFMGLVWLAYSPLSFSRERVRVRVSGDGIKDFFKDRGKDLTLWLLIVGVMFLIIWPGFIFVPDPKGNALLIKRDLVTAGLTPHHMVEDYALNSSHYLLTLVTRTTPVTMFFAGLLATWLMLERVLSLAMHQNKRSTTRLIWLLAAYVLFFVIMMTLVAKKGDRYIMPVFPALDILAAFGILFVSRWIRRFIGHWSLGIGVLAVAFLAGTAWHYHPYAIAYSNPLFPDNLSQELGWGEGLEQVARWLNEHDPDAVVGSWYPEELRAYTSAHVAHINAHEQVKVRYIVLYRNMFGRAPDHYANDFIDEYYKKREPVFVAKVAGKEFAWVYEKWVFERSVGELLPGVRVEQVVDVAHDNLIGVDVAMATYLGKATAGELVVALRSFDQAQDKQVYEWRVPVSELSDTGWLTLRLPEPISVAGQKINIRIEAVGTAPGNAPTLRSTQVHDYRASSMMINGQAKPGDVAVRLRYQVSENQEATEEETRLLK